MEKKSKYCYCNQLVNSKCDFCTGLRSEEIEDLNQIKNLAIENNLGGDVEDIEKGKTKRIGHFCIHIEDDPSEEDVISVHCERIVNAYMTKAYILANKVMQFVEKELGQ